MRLANVPIKKREDWANQQSTPGSVTFAAPTDHHNALQASLLSCRLLVPALCFYKNCSNPLSTTNRTPIPFPKYWRNQYSQQPPLLITTTTFTSIAAPFQIAPSHFPTLFNMDSLPAIVPPSWGSLALAG